MSMPGLTADVSIYKIAMPYYSKVTGSYMSSRSFAQLEPLASDVMCRTLTLLLHHLPGKGPLQAKGTPWAVCRVSLAPSLSSSR
jgi:hypothetical protein